MTRELEAKRMTKEEAAQIINNALADFEKSNPDEIVSGLEIIDIDVTVMASPKTVLLRGVRIETTVRGIWQS